jgi:hypothetical protein
MVTSSVWCFPASLGSAAYRRRTLWHTSNRSFAQVYSSVSVLSLGWVFLLGLRCVGRFQLFFVNTFNKFSSEVAPVREEESKSSGDQDEEVEDEEEDGEEEVGEEEAVRAGERDEGDPEVELFCVEEELEKLANPPPLMFESDFTQKYGFVDDEANPCKLTKWKGEAFDDSKCVNLFGEPIGKDGRNGYPWKSVKPRRIRKRIQELCVALYQRDALPHLLPHKMARGIVLEEEGKLVNWAAYGATTNLSQRLQHARNVLRLQKVKDEGATDPCAWWKIHVDLRELQPEVCKGRGSLMGERVSDGGHRDSRVDYLGRIMAIENKKLEARVAAVEKATRTRDKNATNLQENQGVLALMEKELKKYENNLQVAKAKEVVDDERVAYLTQKVKVYKNLRKKKRKRVKAMETKIAALEEILTNEGRLGAMKRMQVNALRAEYAHLSCGAARLHMRPLPMVYTSNSNCGHVGSIDTGECCVCGFSFPHSNIVVSSCRHVYHP